MIDGSGPLFAPTIRDISARHGAQYFWSEPLGIYSAMNFGATMVESNFFLFLNSGDWLATSHSMSDVNAQVGPTSVAAWLVGQVVLAQDGHVSVSRAIEAKSMLRVRLGLSWFPHPATIYSARSFFSLGGLEPSFQIAADYLLALRMLRTFGPPAALSSAIAVHHLDGLSARRPLQGAWEGTRARVKVFGATQLVIELIVLPSLFLLRQLRKRSPKSGRKMPPGKWSRDPSIEHYCDGSQAQWPKCCADYLSGPEYGAERLDYGGEDR